MALLDRRNDMCLRLRGFGVAPFEIAAVGHLDHGLRLYVPPGSEVCKAMNLALIGERLVLPDGMRKPLVGRMRATTFTWTKVPQSKELFTAEWNLMRSVIRSSLVSTDSLEFHIQDRGSRCWRRNAKSCLKKNPLSSSCYQVHNHTANFLQQRG